MESGRWIQNRRSSPHGFQSKICKESTSW